LMESGMPNRPYLREVIIGNTEQRKKFEGWIFPKIIKKFEVIKAQWEADENLIGFIEGSRLVESGYVSTLEGLIVVKANNEVRRKRLIEKRGLTPEEADGLIASQDPRMAERQADFMWDNSSTLPELFKQIEVFLMVEDPNS
jgi:dephospho-CoA kinase